ncbi:hypothetical protein N0V94_009173 [Neodidymelliopsis sp. IMI 364377]|nr:hypothetical protein N0V94_009173 [Neodidymelliopsis sp. IMI 364377]
MGDHASNNQQPIPDHEIKQNAGVSASMALQATQKAWDLRQAANAAGDPDAREEILAKAINKEIEAESFGKAAKYTQSGAFQGLAAGAGLGVQPGVTIGKVTGAIVGGTVSTVTGLLGGGIGSVYGAMNGPMWDLGQMASQGVRGVVGDFPNWKSTPSQKKALEKMVMQSKETQAPSKEELEKMKSEAPDDMPQSWSQSVQDMTSWRPSMPSMPKMPNVPSASQAGTAMGLGGLGASLGLGGGQGKKEDSPSKPNARQASQQDGHAQRQAAKPKEPAAPRQAPTPKQASTPKEAPKIEKPSNKNDDAGKETKPRKSQRTSAPQKSDDTKASPRPSTKETASQSSNSTPRPKNQATKNASEPKASPPKLSSKPRTSGQFPASGSPQSASSSNNKENKAPVPANGERRKPRKLGLKNENPQSNQNPAPKRAPRKLESRKATA